MSAKLHDLFLKASKYIDFAGGVKLVETKLVETNTYRATVMTTPLPPDLQKFADQQIATGKYTSLDEMLLAGLRILAAQEQIYQGRFEELRREVLLGALEAEQGELLDATSEIEAIRQRLRDRHSQT